MVVACPCCQFEIEEIAANTPYTTLTMINSLKDAIILASVIAPTQNLDYRESLALALWDKARNPIPPPKEDTSNAATTKREATTTAREVRASGKASGYPAGVFIDFLPYREETE